jgi:hypothetical protein
VKQTKAAPKKAPAKKAAPKKALAKKAAPKKAAPKKAPAKKAAPKKAPAKKAPSRVKARADYGAPIDGFFEKHPQALREVLVALRALVETAGHDAEASLKWGMPVYTIGGAMFCALGAHKAHVNLILAGPDSIFPDPEGRLRGTGETGRHLKLTKLAELPTKAVQSWLAAAAKHARAAR